MRQLLIVKAPTSFGSSASPIDNGLTEHGVNDLSGLKAGAISFFELGESTSKYNAMPTKNFAIALGRKNNQRNFIIPEVDIKTLTVTKALPYKGTAFSVVVALGTTTIGKEYTLRFFKKGVVPHERNSWTVSIKATTTNGSSAYAESAALKAAMDSKLSDKFSFTTTTSTTSVTITCNNIGEDWEVVAADDMTASMLTVTHAEKNIGDKAFIQDLASQCAGGKGFYHTAAEGREFIPGYPEDVEDFTLNTSGAYRNGNDDTDGNYSTSGYALYTLRFKVGRDSAKTRDERVWQVVYIAIPVDSNGTYYQITNIDKIIPEGDYMTNLNEASAGTIAATTVTTMVKATSLNE